MFDSLNPLVGEGNVPPAGELCELITDTHRALIEREGELVVLAALWADAHDEHSLPPRGRSRRYGGEDTPEVGEFAAAELGALLGTSTGSAAMLMADALDLRHRLTGLWDRLRAGTVRAWQARKIATATRDLTAEAALRVDDTLTPHLGTLPWARLHTLLEAAIIDADPDAADQRAQAAAAERFLRAGQANEHGLKLLIAKATAGEVIWFIAMANRIADILAADGDPDPIDVRRSKAIGILAQPAHAHHLLTTHQNDPDPATQPDADPATDPGPGNGNGDDPDPDRATDPGPGNGNGNGDDPDPDPATDPGPGNGDDPDPDPATDPGPGNGDDPDPDPATDPGPGNGDDPDPDRATESTTDGDPSNGDPSNGAGSARQASPAPATPVPPAMQATPADTGAPGLGAQPAAPAEAAVTGAPRFPVQPPAPANLANPAEIGPLELPAQPAGPAARTEAASEAGTPADRELRRNADGDHRGSAEGHPIGDAGSDRHSGTHWAPSASTGEEFSEGRNPDRAGPADPDRARPAEGDRAGRAEGDRNSTVDPDWSRNGIRRGADRSQQVPSRAEPPEEPEPPKPPEPPEVPQPPEQPCPPPGASGLSGLPQPADVCQPAHPPEPPQPPEPVEWTDPERDRHRSVDLRPAGGNGAGDGIDHRRARPPVTLHIHLTDRTLTGTDGCPQIARMEGVGPLTIGQVQRFLNDTRCQIRIAPVLDPADVAPVDAYEIPQRLRDAVRLRHLADTFPYASATAAGMDLDHTIPYARGGPTSQDNLTPLDRRHHRDKTLGGWGKRQPDPDTCLWRSPNGWIYLTTNQGTLPLGRTPYAHAAWNAARTTEPADPTGLNERTGLNKGSGLNERSGPSDHTERTEETNTDSAELHTLPVVGTAAKDAS